MARILWLQLQDRVHDAGWCGSMRDELRRDEKGLAPSSLIITSSPGRVADKRPTSTSFHSSRREGGMIGGATVLEQRARTADVRLCYERRRGDDPGSGCAGVSVSRQVARIYTYVARSRSVSKLEDRIRVCTTFPEQPVGDGARDARRCGRESGSLTRGLKAYPKCHGRRAFAASHPIPAAPRLAICLANPRQHPHPLLCLHPLFLCVPRSSSPLPHAREGVFAESGVQQR